MCVIVMQMWVCCVNKIVMTSLGKTNDESGNLTANIVECGVKTYFFLITHK